MELDFSKLLGGEPSGTPTKQDAYQRDTDDGSVKLTILQDDHQRLSEAYKHYQDNIKKSECLQMEILKGVQAGEDTDALFLKACEAISLMTGNSTFYTQTKRDLENR